MKFLAECWTCREAREDEGVQGAVLLPAEITRDFTCTLQCPQGHNERWGIANHLHEVLFDTGALAVLDGYYREAISAFAAAVERFQEFYVRAVCQFREIGDAAAGAAWKPMRSASERQLGAFIMCHLIDAGAAPDLEIEEWRSLRNRATHGGEFVTRDEVVKYGQAAWDHIRKHLVSLRTRHPGAFPELVDTVKSPSKAVNVSKHLPTLLFMAERYYKSWALSDGLEFLRAQRKHTYTG